MVQQSLSIDDLLKLKQTEGPAAVEVALQSMPHSAGELLCFLTFLGHDTIRDKLFKTAAEYRLTKLLIKEDKIPAPLISFIITRHNKWSQMQFRRATALLLELRYLDLDNTGFRIHNDLYDLVRHVRPADERSKMAYWAVVLVTLAGMADPKSVTLAQLNHCRQHVHDFMPRFSEDDVYWEAWSTFVVRLAGVFNARDDFLSAEDLYILSIGPEVGWKHWDAKFYLAVLRTIHLDKWEDAESGIREAVSQGLPRKETLSRSLRELREQTEDWKKRKGDQNLEVKNLMNLARIIYDGMKSQGRSE
jgi:hypothetical protein